MQGRPDGQIFPSWWKPSEHSNYKIFLSFLMKPISSQSDIWVKSYDQNTRACPDGLIERLDGQLQSPFQSSTKSFHTRPRPDGDALSSRRLHFGCTSLPYKDFEHLDSKGWRPDGWTGARNFHIWSLIVRTMKTDVRTVQLCMQVLPYREHHPDGITHRPDGSSCLPITVSWVRNPNAS
jgi:hypothetical protein